MWHKWEGLNMTNTLVYYTEVPLLWVPNIGPTLQVPYFIKYSAHFFTLKMMLKYSLCTIYGRLLRKGLRWLLWWINLQFLIPMKLFLKNKNNSFAKNHCEIQVCTILVCTLYSIKYRKSARQLGKTGNDSYTSLP